MGLGDFIGKQLVGEVVTKYKADTKQMRFELKRLEGDAKKRHQALIDQLDEQNHSIDKANKEAQKAHKGRLDRLKKFAVGAAAAAATALAAYKALSSGLDTLEKNAQLRSATVGLSLEGLRKASNGLIDDTRLLEFAAAAMNGTFKLSQLEMEGALKGTLALRKGGKDLTKTLDNVQKAVTEGTVEPLKELGLVIKGPENDTEAGLQAALGGLNDEATKLQGNFSTAADGIRAAGVDMDNTADKISEDLGRIAVALTPVVKGFAALFSMIANAPDLLVTSETRSEIRQIEDSIRRARARGDQETVNALSPQLRRLLFINREAEAAEASKQAERQQLARAAEMERVRAQARGAGKRPPPGAFEAVEADPALRSNIILGSAAERLFSVSREGGAAMLARRAEERREGLAALREVREFSIDINGAQETLNKNIAAFNTLTNQNNWLEAVFGTPVEIDATAQAINVLAQSFDGFAGAFGAGVGALIDGSASFSQAFNDAIGNTLKGMAVEMSIQAVRHAAFGLGSLAFGNLPQAITHGKAAATFALGAGAAGLAASQFGVGAARAATPASAGGGGAGAGAAGVGPARPDQGPVNGTQTQVFIVGDDFGSLSSRQREARFRQISRQAGVVIPGDTVINV